MQLLSKEEFVAGVALLLVASCSDGPWYRLYWGDAWLYVRSSRETGWWTLSMNGVVDYRFRDALQLSEALWDWGKRRLPEPTR